jgi:hypothetical protein
MFNSYLGIAQSLRVDHNVCSNYMILMLGGELAINMRVLNSYFFHCSFVNFQHVGNLNMLFHFIYFKTKSNEKNGPFQLKFSN